MPSGLLAPTGQAARCGFGESSSFEGLSSRDFGVGMVFAALPGGA